MTAITKKPNRSISIATIKFVCGITVAIFLLVRLTVPPESSTTFEASIADTSSSTTALQAILDKKNNEASLLRKGQGVEPPSANNDGEATVFLFDGTDTTTGKELELHPINTASLMSNWGVNTTYKEFLTKLVSVPNNNNQRLLTMDQLRQIKSNGGRVVLLSYTVPKTGSTTVSQAIYDHNEVTCKNQGGEHWNFRSKKLFNMNKNVTEQNLLIHKCTSESDFSTAVCGPTWMQCDYFEILPNTQATTRTIFKGHCIYTYHTVPKLQ